MQQSEGTHHSPFPPSDLERIDLVLLLEAPPGPPPRRLDKTEAQALLAAIADDLGPALGGLEALQLLGLGSVFDPADLLRPGLPVHQALFSLVQGTRREAPFQPGLVALGSDDGRYPIAALNPTRRALAGPLYVVPMIIAGPSAALELARAEAETRLMRMATVSTDVRKAVGDHFGLPAENASYATLTDLMALLKNSFDALDLEPVWSVLVQALYRAGQPERFENDSGLTVDWTMDEAQLHFLTLDAWGQRQPAADPKAVLAGYRQWLTAYRRAFAALEAHEVPVSLAIASQGEQRLEGSVLIERLLGQTTSAVSDYLHLDDDVGVIAASRRVDTPAPAVEHRYPLTPSAVADVSAGVQARGPVLLDGNPPRLALPEGSSH